MKQSPSTLKELIESCPTAFFNLALFGIAAMWMLMPVFKQLDNILLLINPYIFQHSMGYVSLFLAIILLAQRYLGKQTQLSSKVLINHLPTIFLAVMLLWSLLSALLSDNLSVAFWGDFYRKEGFLTYLSYAGFYLGVYVLDDRHRVQLFNLFIIIATYLSFQSFFEVAGILPLGFDTHPMLSATFHNSNHFAYYLTLAIMIAVGQFLFASKRSYEFIYLLLAGIMMMTLNYNNTFGCYLAVFGGLFFIILCTYLKLGRVTFKSVAPFILFIVISIITSRQFNSLIVNFLILGSDIGKLLDNSQDAGAAGSGRWVLWVYAFGFMLERPIFGYGPDGLAAQYNRVGAANDRPHNEYLQHAASLGIPALFMYLFSLTIILGRCYRHLKQLSSTQLIALGAVVAYLASAFFGNTMYYTTPYFVMVLAMLNDGLIED